jgi:ankyrin repeat protein
MARRADEKGVAFGRQGNTQATAVKETSTSVEGQTVDVPALLAAQQGRAEELAEWLEGGWNPFEGPSLDARGSSALDWSAGNGHMECVKLLLPFAKGVACRPDGKGPAHWAARHGREAVLVLLLEEAGGEGAGVDVRTADGTTLLMLACFGGHIGTAELLYEYDATLLAYNSYECDAGHFAAMGGSVRMCKWLKRMGLAFDRHQCSGHTALHKAADGGHEQVVRYMLSGGGLDASQLTSIRGEAGSEVGAVDPNADTDQYGEAGAVPELPDQASTLSKEELRRRAHLPSALALRKGHTRVADILTEAGL